VINQWIWKLLKEKEAINIILIMKIRKIGENQGEETQSCMQGKLEENEGK